MPCSWLRRAAGGEAELDSAGEPLGVGSFGAQEGQRQVQALDLAEPAFVCGSLPAVEQVCLDLVQACQHSRVDLQDGAAKDPLTELAEGASGLRPRSTDSDVVAGPGSF